MANRQYPPFAFLVPLNEDAYRSIKSTRNERHLGWAKRQSLNDLSGFTFEENLAKRSELCAVRLLFDTMLGWPCISFGSSRTCQVGLEDSPDVGSRQFALHFEPITGILLLTDTSRRGTLIQNTTDARARHLTNSTWPVVGNALLSFGTDLRLKFVLALPTWVTDASRDFIAGVNRHSNSIGRPVLCDPRSAKSTRSPIQTLCDRFALLHRIGSHSNGNVWTGLRLKDGAVFAVKTFNRPTNRNSFAKLGNDTPNQMARAEAEIMRKLRHPNIIRFIEFLPDQDQCAVAMELAPFSNLETLQGSAGKLTESQTKSLVRQILFALAYLHRHGLAHGRLNSRSILVSAQLPIRFKLCGPSPTSGKKPSSAVADVKHLSQLAQQACGSGLSDLGRDFLLRVSKAKTANLDTGAYLCDPWLKQTTSVSKRKLSLSDDRAERDGGRPRKRRRLHSAGDFHGCSSSDAASHETSNSFRVALQAVIGAINNVFAALSLRVGRYLS